MNMEDEFVRCPYYRRDGYRAVHCEGVEDGCGLRLRFRDRAGLEKYKFKCCRADWPRCPVAGMLNRMYDYEP